MREAFRRHDLLRASISQIPMLHAMKKDHNMMVPIMEAIQTLNSYGMEVVSGIILGLDTDKPETGIPAVCSSARNLLGRLEPRVAPIETRDVAELALIRAATGIRDAAQERMLACRPVRNRVLVPSRRSAVFSTT